MKRYSVLLMSLFVLAFISQSPISYAEDDTYTKIQEMVNDLGAPQFRSQNNGKLQQCADGGTKQITIKKNRGGTSYKGIYKKCNEWGRMRDGHVEITMGG